MALALSCLLGLSLGATDAQAATDGKIRVLMVTGDWKSQAWYQDVWMPAPGQEPKLYRGRFIEQKVNEAAPGKFEFTDITNYAGQEYVDAEFLSQYDVLLLGDVIGWSFNPRFRQAVNDFVKNGGGLIYCASNKWHCAMELNTPFADALPAEFTADNFTGDWRKADNTAEGKPFVAQAALPDHPVTKGLDWPGAPELSRAFKILPRADADVLLKSPSGAPILAAWQFGKGRSILSSSIFANDELSEKFGNEWKDFGKYYAQVFAWLGENSTNQKTSLKEATAEVSVEVNFAEKQNDVPNGIFSMHGHDSAGGIPLKGQPYEHFLAINAPGGMARFDYSPSRDDAGAYNFAGMDRHLTELKRLELEPILLFSGYNNGQHYVWADGSSWSKPSDASIRAICDDITATLTHTNGKKGDPNYKPNVQYIELLNEPDINFETAPGFGKLMAAIYDHVHANFPGVKVGAYGSYEVPYLKAFLDACGGKIDWISRHPYGWTGEMLFKAQDEFAEYARGKGYDNLQFIVTEWDFWIQGRQKFDYMVKRYFEAVKRDNLLGTLHYRYGQYGEPIYLFGMIWLGGQNKGVPPAGTPMHDAYDAFWIFRDFRGQRAATTTTAPESTGDLARHVIADATANGDKLNVVMYYDWAYGGEGYPNYDAGTLYNKVNANVKLALTPADKDRTLTLSKATGEGFEVVKKDVKIPAGQAEYTTTVEMTPVTAYSITIE